MEFRPDFQQRFSADPSQHNLSAMTPGEVLASETPEQLPQIPPAFNYPISLPRPLVLSTPPRPPGASPQGAGSCSRYLQQQNELWEPLDGLHHQPVERDPVWARHLPLLRRRE